MFTMHGLTDTIKNTFFNKTFLFLDILYSNAIAMYAIVINALPKLQGEEETHI